MEVCMIEIAASMQKQPLTGDVQMFCTKMFSKNICKFHTKTPVLESLFNKVAGLKPWVPERLRPTTLFKNRLWHWCFPVKFAKFLITPIVKNICERLLLYMVILKQIHS